MKNYQILGWNKNKDKIVDGKFIAPNVYMAVKRFIHELSNNLDIEEGDLYHLMDVETGEVINYLKY